MPETVLVLVSFLSLELDPVSGNSSCLLGSYSKADGPPRTMTLLASWLQALLLSACCSRCAISSSSKSPQMLASAWWETICYNSLCQWLLPPWDQLFRSDKDSNTSPIFYHFFSVLNSRLLSPSMPLIKALQTCDKLLLLVVNPGFYCFVISCTNVWHFIHLSLLIFPQQNKDFS